MPKPTRRERRLGKIKPPRRPFIPPSPPPSQGKEAAVEQSSRPAAGASAGEYGYIYKDLQRIAVLAGIMFAALILLSFIIK